MNKPITEQNFLQIAFDNAGQSSSLLGESSLQRAFRKSPTPKRCAEDSFALARKMAIDFADWLQENTNGHEPSMGYWYKGKYEQTETLFELYQQQK